jgi:hypothetical protein
MQGQQCSRNSACRFGLFSGTGIDVNYGASCGQPVGQGGGQNGSQCAMSSECQGNLCLVPDGGMNGVCHDPCRSASDCPGGFRTPPQACEYVKPDPAGSALVAACVQDVPGGDSGVPSPCFSLGVSDCTNTATCQPQSAVVGGTTYSVLTCR